MDDEIFIVKENIRFLKKEIDDLKLEYTFLSSGKKLMNFKGRFFEDDLNAKRKDQINSIIGYSGKIIDTNHLDKNINSRPKIILMHGEKDEVVPVSFLLEAKEFFIKNQYKIETKIFKNCEHRIPSEGSSIGLEFIKKNLY